MEIIQPYVITLWEERLFNKIDPEKAIETANATDGVRIVTSSSERKGMVGMGGAIYDTLGMITTREPITYAVAIGSRRE